jgi:ribosomal protein S4
MKGIHVFIENLGSLLPYLFPPKNNAKDTIPCYQISKIYLKVVKKKTHTPCCICYHITNKTNLDEIQEEVEIKREKSKETLVDVYQHHQS